MEYTATYTKPERFPEFEEIDIYSSWKMPPFRGRRVEGYTGIREKGRDDVVSVVSSKYRLIQHQEVYDIIKNFLDVYFRKEYESRLGFSGCRRFPDSGTRMEWTLVFNEFRYDIECGSISSRFPQLNDTVYCGLKVLNSVDSSIALTLAPYSERVVCANGMTHTLLTKKFKFKHYKDPIDMLINNLPVMMSEISSVYDEIISHYQSWTKIPIVPENVVDMFENIKKESNRSYLTKNQSDLIMVDCPDTAWGLFNVLTEENTYSDRRDMLSKFQQDRNIEQVMKIIVASNMPSM